MKKTFLIKFLITAFLMGLSTNLLALDEIGEDMQLYLGEPKVVSLSNPTRIMVGNPNIVDVTNVTKSEMTVNPKAIGTTTIVFWDSFGEQSYKVHVYTEDMSETKGRVDNILRSFNIPGIYTKASDEEGKVFILGKIKNAADKDKIAGALSALKDKILDLTEVREDETVVEIDVQVLELDKDATSTLGFSWPGSITATEVGSKAISDAGAKISEFFNVSRLTRDAFSWSLDALIQEGKAKVLSRPRLACQSGKEAELLVGGEKPVFTTQVASAGGQGTNVEYKEFGIKLKIRPSVVEDRQIKLALNVEVSEVGEAETIGPVSAPTAKAYPLSKRSAATELFLSNGQTLGIGGLIKQKEEEDYRRTPFFSDVPIIGMLFRKKSTKIGDGTGGRGNTELFIILTPKIVREDKDMARTNSVRIPETASVSLRQNIDSPFTEYAHIIQQRIMDNFTYPALARQAGFQGTVKLGLHLSHTGAPLEVRVKESSGYKVLDDNAIYMASQMGSYPPFPSSIDQKEIWIDVPIVYHLEN